MDTERNVIDQWEYVGILVNDWKVLDWTSLIAFHPTDAVITQGMHWIDALKNIGLEGWEMCAAHPDGMFGTKEDTRYWFKRRIP
jgi:hypothetical protein